MTKKLTDKQKFFCKEYIIDFNATKAAIRAGYSKKTSYSIGHNLLKREDVSERITKEIEKRKDRVEVDQDYVINVIVETIDRCRQVAPVLDMFGNRVKIETKDGTIAGAFKFDAKNVLKGAELLGKHFGIFTEKQSVDHRFFDKDGKPFEFEVKVVKSDGNNRTL